MLQLMDSEFLSLPNLFLVNPITSYSCYINISKALVVLYNLLTVQIVLKNDFQEHSP